MQKTVQVLLRKDLEHGTLLRYAVRNESHYKSSWALSGHLTVQAIQAVVF